VLYHIAATRLGLLPACVHRHIITNTTDKCNDANIYNYASNKVSK